MSAKGADYHQRLTEFMISEVLPARAAYDEYRAAAGPQSHTVPPVVEELKAKARQRGLWNLFLPSEVRADQPGARPAGRADRLERRDRAGGRQLRRTGHRQLEVYVDGDMDGASSSACWPVRSAAVSR